MTVNIRYYLIFTIWMCLNVSILQAQTDGAERSKLAAKADSLDALSSSLYDACKYDDAILIEKEALDIYEAIYGAESETYISRLNNLALYYSGKGLYVTAVATAERVVKLSEALWQRVKSKYALSQYAKHLSNLAVFYAESEDFEKAIESGNKALEIRGEIYGKNHAVYAKSLNNLATYYHGMGNDSASIRIITEVLEIREKKKDEDPEGYSMSLRNLSNSYALIGDFQEAYNVSRKAQIFMDNYKDDYPDEYASTLENLASCVALFGKYKLAIQLEMDALDIIENLYGANSLQFAKGLHNQAVYMNVLGYYPQAASVIGEAIRIYEESAQKESSDHAKSLSVLASCAYEMGNYAVAVECSEQSLNIIKRILGTEHPDYATALCEAALYNSYVTNKKKVNSYAISGTMYLSKYLKNAFAGLTSFNRRSLWQWYAEWFEVNVHDLAYRLTSDQLVANGYNSILLCKGILLNTEIEFSKIVGESNDTIAQAEYDSLVILRQRIDRLLEKTKAERNIDVDSLETIAAGLENSLISRSKVLGDYTANLAITWEQVQEKLDKSDAAIEFVSFPLANDSTVMYIAYVLRKGWESPKMIPLFTEQQLKMIDTRDYYRTDNVSKLVWEPLSKELEGASVVYFAPSGELYNIAIEHVPDYETNRSALVSDSRVYYRLSSTRELALKREKDNWKDAAVYGGLTYGMNAASIINNSRSFSYDKADLIAITGDYYSIADTLMRAGLVASDLKGTRNEAVAIDKALENSGISTTLYMDSIGTEASFKKMSGKKVSIMHIGTHGFYWTEQEAKKYNYNFLLLNNQSNRYAEDKQLTRSGLLFAGANYSLSANREKLPEDVDDGILTAKELTSIDLRGLDLVVLSACQTGLGEITGDGVFGLQRGFKKAGAQTIIMSLWKVNDKATELFMTKFFEEIKVDKNGHPINKHEAYLAAQNYLRKGEAVVEVEETLEGKDLSYAQDEHKPTTRTTRITFEDPKYWAAFIMLDGID